MTNLQGASILLVGASGGLGREMASLLHDRGALLTLAGRNEDSLRALGIPGAIVSGDVTQSGVPEQFVQAALDAHGKLDGVIYAAGAVAFGPASGCFDSSVSV
jgi:cyclic-di-GMP-binding biofilm dispersal mediator protein